MSEMLICHTTEEQRLACVDQVNSAPLLGLEDGFDQITQTDWFFECERPWVDEILKIITPNLRLLAKEVNCARFDVTKSWIQRYWKDSYHEFHVHPGTMFNLIYYIELPDDAPVTEFRMGPKGKETTFTPDVAQGDIILAPSYLYHRSPRNQADSQKTVFVANVDIE